MESKIRSVIRPERPSDAAPIHDVNRAAFPGDGEARLVDSLRAAGRLTISLVAEEDGALVGCIAFSPVTIDGAPRATGGIGLAPVAVLPGRQKQGIGSALIRAGLAECRARGYRFVVVLGDPAYYARFGFERASAHGLGNVYGCDEEFRVIELVPGALAAGTAQYAPEFAGL